MSIPAVKMFKDEEIVDEFVGAMPESAIKEWLDNNLAE
jgi:thioredoxin-like negative regulator of GroEL